MRKTGHISAFNTVLETTRKTAQETKQEIMPPLKERVLLSSQAVSIIRAMERIVETDPNHPPEAQKIEDWRRDAADVHAKEVMRFAKSEVEEVVQVFIADQLSALESSIADGDLSSGTIRSVEDKIAEAGRALAKNNSTGAVEAVLQVEQRVETDAYVAGTSAETKND